MGVEVAIATAVVSTLGGISQRAESNKRAGRRADREVELIELQTNQEIKRRENLLDDIIDDQRLAILNSGTLIEGSPIMVLEETRRKGQEEIDSFLEVQKRRTAIAAAGGKPRDEFLGGISDIATGFGFVAPFLGGGGGGTANA